jgi:hypothetical protein
MKCDQITEKFSDYLTGEIDDMSRKDIQEHVTSCNSCREELESLSAIWTKLGVLKEELPSKNLRTQFYTNLEEYKQNMRQENTLPKKRTFFRRWFAPVAPVKPAFQFSFAALFLVVGLTAGFFLSGGLRGGGEIAQLRQEIRQIRQITAVSLLRQETFREQLRNVGWRPQVGLPDEDTLSDFLRSVAGDSESAPKLAALDILSFFSESPLNEEEWADALADQTSPLVKLALAFSSHVKSF